MKIVENSTLSKRGERYQELAAKAIDEVKKKNDRLVQEGRLVWSSEGRLTVPNIKKNSPKLFHLLNQIRSLTNSNPEISSEIARVIAATLREAPSAPLSERIEFQHQIEAIEGHSKDQESITR